MHGPIRLETISTILDRAQEPRFVVEGLVDSTATLIIGEPMVGKTYLVASLVSALVRGDSEWLGRKVQGVPRNIAIGVTDPGGKVEIAGRLSALKDDDRVLLTDVRQASSEYWTDLCDSLREKHADLFVLDNLLGSIQGDVNNAKDTRALTDGLNTLIDEGITVVVLHHVAKGADYGYRKSPLGSQHIAAWTRSILLVQKSSATRRKLTAWGNNYPETKLTLDMHVSDGVGEFSVAEASSEAEVATGRKRSPERLDEGQKIVQYVISDCQGLTKKETAHKIAAQFDGEATSHESYLSGKGRWYGTLLVYNSKSKTWRRNDAAVDG